MCTAARSSVEAFACAPFTSRWTSRTIEAVFAALTIAVVVSDSHRRVTWSRSPAQPSVIIRRLPGRLTRRAARSSAVRDGTTQRTVVNAPADGPAMNRLGRSAYSAAEVTIAAEGQNGDSPIDFAPAS